MLLRDDEFGCLAMPRVKTFEAWAAEHRPHMDGKAFGEEPFPHPSGTWMSTVCACGAKHVRDAADDKPFTYDINDDPRR